ncbi:hypothetical protein Asp14428_67270 [Actinoplanes sp. NBRC 14428]|nr:hypothetical protein Asp14428_67270 [Actinoplanes sp. NBRC 14428]
MQGVQLRIGADFESRHPGTIEAQAEKTLARFHDQPGHSETPPQAADRSDCGMRVT